MLRIAFSVLAAGLLFAGTVPSAFAQTSQVESAEIWKSLKPDIIGDRAVKIADSGVLQIIAPKRAQDAGLVPVDIQFDPVKAKIVAITLVVDVNPSPLAAVFKLGKDGGVSKISTRLRVNDYSFVRAIAETESGELMMSETYVKATGGCSAPAVRNPEDAKATLGVMKLRQFPPETGVAENSRRELQLMIRHPNHSGFQMDQVTRYIIPPHFINKVSVSQGGEPIISMEGGISISEDPNFRFNYLMRKGNTIEAVAEDTKGNTFHASWAVEATGL